MTYTFEHVEINSCQECIMRNSLYLGINEYCLISRKNITIHVDSETKPDNCPLKELNSCWGCPVQSR